MSSPYPLSAERERARLQVLDSYQVLDTGDEAVFDAFVALAAELADTPIALVSLVDEKRQWFKARRGITIQETPRDQAFCAYTLDDRVSTLEVEDARTDDRFKENPLVTGDPGIRFYAGFPLVAPDGSRLGTICVIDRKPRTLTAGQRDALLALSRAVMAVLDARREFYTLFESAQLDVLTFDAETMKVVFASMGAANHLGYDHHALIGKEIAEIYEGLTAPRMVAALETMRGGHAWIAEVQARRRDGSSFPVEIRADLSGVDGSQRILAIASDISVQVGNRRRLDLLSRAMNETAEMLRIFEVDETSTRLRLIYMNDAFARATNWRASEAIGKEVDDFRFAMPDDDGMRRLREAVLAGSTGQDQVVAYRRDGSGFWALRSCTPIRDVRGTITHWVFVERDVSKDVEETARLEEQNDRLAALAPAAREIVAALDGKGLVEFVVAGAQKVLGASGLVLAKQGDGRVVEVRDSSSPIAPDAEPFHCELAIRLNNDERLLLSDDRFDLAVGIGRSNRSDLILHLHRDTRPFERHDLFLVDLFAQFVSVAVRNTALYGEVERRRNAIYELSRTKSDLIAMLAHDFRGPLTTIVGFADLLGEVGELTEEQRSFTHAMKQAALDLSNLAADTLALSRLERNELVLSLGEVDIESVLRDLAVRYVDRREIDIEADGESKIIGDGDRIVQVFSNLIENAIKYSPAGEAIEVRILREAKDVVVTVRDRGIGIPKSEISSLFERFTRASNARKMKIPGTGFGLFLTRQLVRLHGGTITLASEEGQGTTVTVRLPFAPVPSTRPHAVALVGSGDRTMVLADELREAGYRVRIAAQIDELGALLEREPVGAVVLAAQLEEGSADTVESFQRMLRERGIPLVTIGEGNVRGLKPKAHVDGPPTADALLRVLDNMLGDSAATVAGTP
ncbi:MAG: PAS domain-containing protein [Candidatus Eremiobacteraeota bacterium]|nr:PAS domain-containing protein [Candidatus Eremiobacteraeota bacterium]